MEGGVEFPGFAHPSQSVRERPNHIRRFQETSRP